MAEWFKGMPAGKCSAAGFESLMLRRERVGGQSQLELLRDTDWNVLIILDACRADYFHQLCSAEAATVRSPATYTRDWFRKAVAASVLDGCKYFNANPIVTEETQNHLAEGIVHVANITEGWGIYDSVHPRDVNKSVKEYIARAGQPERMVIHYMQPHAPAILTWESVHDRCTGDPPPTMCAYVGPFSWAWAAADTVMMDWLGLRTLVFSMEMHEALPESGQLHKGLAYAYAQIRRLAKKLRLRGHLESEPRTYIANLLCVWDYVQAMLESLRGTVVVTADHGELLGEYGGRRGHNKVWQYPELHAVPWLVLERGTFRPQPVQAGDTFAEGDTQVIARLEALGYR